MNKKTSEPIFLMGPEVLASKIRELQGNGVGKKVLSRYNDFHSFAKKSEEEWFSELCFCLLTANTSSEMGSRVQNALGFDGFYNLAPSKLSSALRAAGSRFYNRRAEFIIEAREHFGLKEKLSEFPDDRAARAYLAENVKGFGYKEASHFLRNTGSDNVAILDKHVVNLIAEHSIIPERPKYVNARNYLEIESRLDSFAQDLDLNHSQLDLYMWYLQTGKVLK